MARRTPIDILRKRQLAGSIVRTEPGGYTVPRHYFGGPAPFEQLPVRRPAGGGLPPGYGSGPINRLDPTAGGGKPGTNLPTLGNGGDSDPCAIIWPSRQGTGYELCRVGIGVITGPKTPSTPGQQPSPPVADPNQSDTCPTGYWKLPGTGQCVSVSDILPGGQPFTVPAGMETVMGAFGMPAVTPTVVGQHMRQDGSVGLDRRCPGGMVLGKDNLCYPRQVLPRRSQYRKWRASPRPPISAAQWKQLKTADRVRDKVKDVAKVAGFTTKKR